MLEPKRIESRRNHDGSWYCVHSHVIGAPPPAVFAVLADLGAYARWWPGVSIRLQSKLGGSTAPGARGSLALRSGLVSLRSEFVVEEAAAGKKIRLLLADGGAKGPLVLGVAPVDDACRVSLIFDGVRVEAPLPRFLFRFLGARTFDRSSVRALKGLEKFVAEKRRKEPEAPRRKFEWRGATPGE